VQGTIESSESIGNHVTRVIDVGERSVGDAVMATVVDVARGLAGHGDTVLLARPVRPSTSSAATASAAMRSPRPYLH